MHGMKKFLCLALVVVFVFSALLTGCGTKTGTGSDTPATTDKQKAPVPTETVELTMTLVGNKQETDTDLVMREINDYLSDKLNVKLNLQVFGWGDPYETRVNTMLSSGEPFDVCFTASWAANYLKNASAGYLYDLTEFLKKYPAIYEVAGKDFVNGSAIDGRNFAVPTHKETAHNWGYLLQKKYVDKYGFDISKVKKMEDLDPWFEQVKGEVTPLLIVAGDSPFQFLDWDRISDDNVPGALYPDNRNNNIVNHFLAPESVQMYKKLRDYYQRGYIAADAATMENTAEQMKTGKYFAVEQSLKPGKAAEMTGSTGVEWVQVDITKPVMTNRETTGALLGIPAASKNPERAFQFIEMLYTDATLRNMLTFGIEGTHYAVNADGRVTVTQEGKDRYNPGNPWRYGDQFKDLLMDNEDFNKWIDFKAYNDSALPMTSLGFVFNDESVSTQSSACKTVVTTYYKELGCGAVDVDSTLKNYESELKASGADAIIAEMQNQYDAWRAKVGK